MTKSKPNGWEEEFDKKFPFRGLTDGDYYTMTDIKDFIHQAILSAEERGREKFGKDTERLDFLDKLNKGLNNHYGTDYGWEMVINHNVTRIFTEDVNTIDLNDSASNGYESCREAIDKAIHSLSTAGKETK